MMTRCLFFLLSLILSCEVFAAKPHAEFLTRGAVALTKGDSTGVFVSWRSLEGDPSDLGFDVYRNGKRVNASPVSDRTCFTDPDGRGGDSYRIVAATPGAPAGTETSECVAWSGPFMKLHLDRPEPWSSDYDGRDYSYSPDDCSIGDVDGDGVMEIFVKWLPAGAKDSAHKGFTAPTVIDCYRLDGTRLWRVDLGRNIRSGQHYTQFLVCDFDGNGRAEMICKTAPGTVDGRGKHVLLGNDTFEQDNRQWIDQPGGILGHVKGGGEYLTVFDGLTGAEIHTIPYRYSYSSVSEELWGDNHCNRSDRYLACVAHLHGSNHSAVMCRGYYNAATVWAVDFDGKKLKEHWHYQALKPGQGLWGEGAHAVTVGDVDGDGYDEIIYGGGALDHDGKLLYRTNPTTRRNVTGHGDALHLAKMIPDREGLQVFMPHESKNPLYPYDVEMRDARTGEILYSLPQTGNDIGRGLAANVSPLYLGYEYWSARDRNVYSQGEKITHARLPINFRIYWDGDLLDELYDGTRVSKPAPDFSDVTVLADFRSCSDASSCNWTKKTPNLQADLFGDWREEVILHDSQTKSDLLIFTTTIPTEHKLPCLLQDHQYRMAIAWQNCCYNQPPHLSYSPEDRYNK